MNIILTSVLVANVFFFSALPLGAEEGSSTPARKDEVEFTYFLKNRPLDMDQLLGKYFSEVAPGESWQTLPSPEECNNPSIKYGVFARSDLRSYMKGWRFLTDNYCVSDYSMFLMFFNKGFVFRAELRYIPDSFTGTVSESNPGFCADHTPIFKMFAREFRGTSVAQPEAHELKRYTSNYIMTLSTGGGTTNLVWDLRGAPCFQ